MRLLQYDAFTLPLAPDSLIIDSRQILKLMWLPEHGCLPFSSTQKRPRSLISPPSPSKPQPRLPIFHLQHLPSLASSIFHHYTPLLCTSSLPPYVNETLKFSFFSVRPCNPEHHTNGKIAHIPPPLQQQSGKAQIRALHLMLLHVRHAFPALSQKPPGTEVGEVWLFIATTRLEYQRMTNSKFSTL
jgi:hypothetical protein